MTNLLFGRHILPEVIRHNIEFNSNSDKIKACFCSGAGRSIFILTEEFRGRKDLS
ncbi:hypothetical protein [Chryseobacterium sp. IHB B 17019]|uniref:hypothetical protein n=1 Tax=Chryseobacterium sp. IHB B 17019 TaxID=1721091 RepID=UPI00161864A7|nr:hypothetical protein [Chryseobacterium sp. IHB B 17019]